MNTQKKKVLVTSNTSWTITNFRLSLIQRLNSQGYHVIVLAKLDESSQKFTQLGIEYIDLPIDLKGLNPFQDLKTLLFYLKIYHQKKPDFVFAYTIKSVIYSGIATRLLKIVSISTITGLGTAFLSGRMLTQIAGILYKFALKRNRRIFFQNKNDMDLFLKMQLCSEEQSVLVNGSGINLDKFPFNNRNFLTRPLKFIMVARVIYDKGVREYFEAATEILRKGLQAQFYLMGQTGADNRSSVPDTVFQEWLKTGVVTYLGFRANPIPDILNADIMVLPSYREGLSRSLIEGAALGLPIVTTRVPGCQECVDEGLNGFLCEPRNSESLQVSLEKILSLSDAEIIEMRKRSRAKAENSFGEERILNEYLKALVHNESGR